MAWPPTIPSTYSSFIFFTLLLPFASRSSYGFGLQLSFDIHHRYSDPVKAILGGEGLPEKGSVEYYVTMAHRDRIIRGRHLAASNNQSSPLTFSSGNNTRLSTSLGHLYYANISVGTPSLSFFVALDTSSDLFWLPCECEEGGCVTAIQLSSGLELLLNIYRPSNSSTSEIVSCNSKLCTQNQCPSAASNCPYKVDYPSVSTSSTGILVGDVLHLITDDDQLKAVDIPITFGCGQSQTGALLKGFAPNGLFGLGMGDISVPSTLAKNGLASNSFSMCFTPTRLGRITFGNNGSLYQKETPFNVEQSHPTYNISITQIVVGSNSSELGLSVIFDSSTSHTSLTDPTYTFISESFNSQMQNKRHSVDSSQIPFEYCYELRPNEVYEFPSVHITMKGGDQYFVTNPIEVVDIEGGNIVYCLAIVRSKDISIIGQNFMTGYRIVFDREKMVLGWKESNCYDEEKSNTLAVSPSHSPSASPNATEKNGISPSPKLKSFAYALTVLLASLFAFF